MSTYHQYSEIVAAYGNRLPPPQPQTPRLTLPLVYAAIGLVLGTFTGTAAAVISLQPGMDNVTSHLSLASLRETGFRIHPIANAGQPPVIENHANNQIAPATQPAALQNHVATEAAATAQTPTVQDHASAASPVAHLEKPSPIPSHTQSQMMHALPGVVPTPKPVVKLATAVPVPVVAPLKDVATTVASADQVQTAAPTVHQSAATAKLAAVPAQPVIAQTPTPDATPVPPATAMPTPLGLDGGLKVQFFYSEGDATVVSYNADSDTVQTDDGRTFVIGTTVSVSSATSWDDYRANVHYRCDQNGHCTLTRTGVIALNARLI